MTLTASRTFKLLFSATAVLVLGLAVSVVFSQNAAPSDWVAPARAARKKNPVAADEASIAAGKDLYQKNCLACHGLLGKGDGPAAAALVPTKPHDLSDPKIAEQSDGAFFWKITEGKAPMPSFEKTLSETERWQVLIYVRTLQTPAASQPATPSTKP